MSYQFVILNITISMKNNLFIPITMLTNTPDSNDTYINPTLNEHLKKKEKCVDTNFKSVV